MTDQRKNSRRGNNEGSIREKKDRGYWEAQITINGKRMTKTFKTRTEAQKWNREMQNQAEVGFTVDTARLTMQDALQQWLENSKSTWQPKTYSRYSETVRLHIQPNIKPRLKVVDVRPEHVDAILNVARNKGYGDRTVQYILGTLKKFFSYLVLRKVITYNPAKAGQKVTYKRPTITSLNQDQVKLFMKAAAGNPFEHLYYLAFVTGMREGELLGLMWSDIDFHSDRSRSSARCSGSITRPTASSVSFSRVPKAKRAHAEFRLGQKPSTT